ncbi:SPOR domain-containing protein [Bradyrhizobium lablabi]|uniref:SPOR domain-containing protein n=1 Tax=Bradyrhizobium lablabi TaxID=722472 RepID=UPI001BAA53B3|nr:SPOR domain-containing protein [Bradyrhizobium lablabi]MBR1120773.1 SPOR domain-containing protein [Bradyrhizobium lablabi]
MADRYQNRTYPAQDEYGRGNDPHGQAESDPLAELARLIGQTDPFAMGRANVKAQPRSEQRQPVQQHYEPPPAYEDEPPAGPPPWMQRANRQEAAPPPPPQQDYYDEPEYQPSPVHPLHRYAAQHAAPEPQYAPQPQYQQPQYQQPQHQQPQYQDEQQYARNEQAPDPSRYDDALYGQIESGQDYQRDPAYPDDPYAYQNAYEEEPEEEPRKRGGLITVAAVVALAVLGTSAAFGYRTFVGSPRSGEPPIIKADNSPTKVMPAAAESAPKAPDRMALGDGTEKLVPREETPVDVNRSGPRIVPLTQNPNPPSPASVAPTGIAPAPTANGTMPNNEPRRIRTLSVKGDQTDAGVPPGAGAPPPRPAAPAVVAPAAPARTAAAPAAAAPAPRNPASANASANGPLSLSPQGSPAPEPPARVAAASPAQVAPASNGNGGNYLVQVSSQKTEADAQASYRALQSKFSNVLGSRQPVIRRADLGDKGTVYRAFVGPFSTRDEATSFCSNFRTAGGQCFVPSN